MKIDLVVHSAINKMTSVRIEDSVDTSAIFAITKLWKITPDTAHEVIAEINNVRINRETFSTLEPEKYIDAQIVDFFFAFLSKRFEMIQQRELTYEKQLFFSSTFQNLSGISCSLDPEQVRNNIMLHFTDVCDADKVFIPVDITGAGEWVLFVVRVDDFEMICYYSGQNLHQCQEYCKKIHNWLMCAFATLNKMIASTHFSSWRVGYFPWSVQITLECDSGPMMLSCAEFLSVNIIPADFADLGRIFRVNIAKTILAVGKADSSG